MGTALSCFGDSKEGGCIPGSLLTSVNMLDKDSMPAIIPMPLSTLVEIEVWSCPAEL